MNSLSDMVGAALKAYEEGQALDLARSAEWLQVRDRYAWLSSRLIVNGHEAVAGRIDREYQTLREALLRAATSSAKPKIKDNYPLWEAATEFLLTVKHLDHLGGQIEELSKVKPAETIAATRAVPKRSWIQEDLDEAIAQYQASRAARYKEMLSILDNSQTPERRKRVVRREAQRIFGRNAVADALGVKATRMVSRSPVWVKMADTLGLPRRSRSGPPSGAGQRVGLEIAAEQASLKATETNDYAAADTALLRQEREETLSRINKLARSGGKTGHSNAKAMLQKYEAGEMTDEQVRQSVDLLLETA